MKPVARMTLAAFVVLTGLLAPGCGRPGNHTHESGEPEHAHAAETGVTFNARKGLRVPPATARFIGLQVADVEERKVAATFQFSAQVYRASSEARFASLPPAGAPAALASGNVSSVDAPGLHEGQTVSAQIPGVEGSLPGRVVGVERGLEKASGQVEVLAAIPDARHALALGATLSVTVSLGGEKNVVSVPRSALFRTTEGDFVYTVSGEHFMRTPVRLGVVNPEFAEVTDGLYAGDQIVLQPVMTLWLAELQSLRGGKACADGH
jgi:multidrug efflux pump subunit AcrA (membrane-fusion protein)